MYILKEIGNRPNISYHEYTCDSIADITNIKNVNFGDECYIIEVQSLYVRSSENKWKLIYGTLGVPEEIETGLNDAGGETFNIVDPNVTLMTEENDIGGQTAIIN